MRRMQATVTVLVAVLFPIMAAAEMAATWMTGAATGVPWRMTPRESQ